MEFTENGYIKIPIKKLLEWTDKNEGCFVSNKITKEGFKVGYMYREMPEYGKPDSGWRFFKGDETDEYSSDPANFNLFSLNTVCNYDPDIIKYLNSPTDSVYIRISDSEFEIDNDAKEIYIAKQIR